MIEQTLSFLNLPNHENVERCVFPNASTLLAFKNPTSPAVSFRGYLPIGSVSDFEGKHGLAHLTSSMLMSGTLDYPFRELHQRIESLGASISIGSGALSTTFSGLCLKEDLPEILRLLKNVLERPSFPEDHFRRVKNQTLTAIAIRSQDTAEMADQAFDRKFYRDHPYAHPSIGYAQTVSQITLEDLHTFHSRYFGPVGLVMAVSGGIDTSYARKVFADTLADWQKPIQASQNDLPPFQPLSQTYREHVSLPEKSQTDLIIGTLAPPTLSPDFHACSLGNNILGQFGMMGRIGESVREKAGLAYYAQSELGTGLGPVSWQVVAGINPDNLERAVHLILRELERFITEPVTEQELEDVRQQTLGRLPISLETNHGVAQMLLNMERYHLGLDYLQRLPALLKAITPEAILIAAQKYWDLSKLVITSAGRSLHA